VKLPLFPANLGALILTGIGGYLAINPPSSLASKITWVGLLCAVFIAEAINSHRVEVNSNKTNNDLNAQLNALTITLETQKVENAAAMSYLRDQLQQVLSRPSEAKELAREIIEYSHGLSTEELIKESRKITEQMRIFEHLMMVTEGVERQKEMAIWSSANLPGAKQRLHQEMISASTKRHEEIEQQFKSKFKDQAIYFRDELSRKIKNKKEIKLSEQWHPAFEGIIVGSGISEIADYLDLLANAIERETRESGNTSKVHPR
jgi:hypothetical protein